MSLRVAAKRQSHIPRLSKLPLSLNNYNGITHASKPTHDPVPMTPAANRTIIKKKHLSPSTATKNPPPVLANKQEPEVSALELAPFGRQPMVNFGDVTINQTEIRYVAVRNVQDHQQQLFVKSSPKPDKGVNLSATEFYLAPNTETYIVIAWTPKNICSLRETISFQDVNRMPYRIIIFGNATKPKELAPKVSVRPIRRNIPLRLSPSKQLTYVSKIHKSPTKRIVHNLISSNKALKRLGVVQSPRRQSALIVRKLLAKQDAEFATRVQSYFRMINAKAQLYGLLKQREEKVQQMIRAATLLQTRWRMILSRRQLVNLKVQRNTVIKLQSYFRMVNARTQLCDLLKKREERISLMNRAAVLLQTRFRMLLSKHHCEKLRLRRNAVIKLQSFFRMVSAKMLLSCLVEKRDERAFRMNRAATLIQTRWRMVMARCQLVNLRLQKDAVIKVQSFFRLVNAKTRLYYLLEEKKKRDAVIKVQSHFRMVHAKTRLYYLLEEKKKRDAVIKVQSYFRMVHAKTQLYDLLEKKKKRDAVIKVQTYIRMIAALELVKGLSRYKKAILRLHANWLDTLTAIEQQNAVSMRSNISLQ